MSLVTLKELLSDALENTYAVGGFVTFDLASTEAIINAAEATNSAAIVMIPWGMIAERKNRSLYLKQTCDLVKNSTAKIALHLDHGASVDECVLAIQAGFSSVMYDGSSLPFEENIANTKKVVEIAHACGVSVEAEIGHVGGAEAGVLHKEGLSADASLYTTVEEAVSFVDATNVDALAIAIGTVHGIVKGTPKLDLERLASIREALNIPLVLHGGSGLSDETFRDAVKNGINKINYFTEMSMTASQTTKDYIAEVGDTPIHMMQITECAYASIQALVEKQIKLFKLQ